MEVYSNNIRSATNAAETGDSPTCTATSRLRAALEYARSGWPVFPCVPGGKEPDIAKHEGGRGHLDATTDPEQIRAWWRDRPDANIGIPTGERSGVLALDVDPDKGGRETLARLEAAHGKLPATRTHGTGGGGEHPLFCYPAGAHIRNSVDRFGPGLDVRGEGGYIVAPPSRTEGTYMVLDARPMAGLPWTWRELLETVKRPVKQRSGGLDSHGPISIDTAGTPIPEGQRNDGLTRIAGRLHDGRSLEALEAALLEINATRCNPPLPVAEVAGIARSIHRLEPCKPTRPAPTPEMLDVLDEIEAAWWAADWPGLRGDSCHDVMRHALMLARQYGELLPCGGIRVECGQRPLARGAGLGSVNTLRKAIGELKAGGWWRSDNAGRSGTQSGAFVLVVPAEAGRATVTHSTHVVPEGSSVSTLRAPVLRHSAPHVRRLGKRRGRIVLVLEAAGGTLELETLAAAVGVRRARDLRRRYLEDLESAGVIETVGNVVQLAADWRERLDEAREAGGEFQAARLQLQRDRAASAAWRDELERRRCSRLRLRRAEPAGDRPWRKGRYRPASPRAPGSPALRLEDWIAAMSPGGDGAVGVAS